MPRPAERGVKASIPCSCAPTCLSARKRSHAVSDIGAARRPSTLSDGTVILRPFTLADVERYVACEDDELRRWLSGGVSTQSSVRRWILSAEEQWRNGGPAFTFAICHHAFVVGMVEAGTDSASMLGLLPGDANISYGLFPEHRGKGYVRRAVSLVERFLADRGVTRAVVRMHPDNVASVNVAERLGYVPSGMVVGGGGEPLRLYVKQLASSGPSTGTPKAP